MRTVIAQTFSRIIAAGCKNPAVRLCLTNTDYCDSIDYSNSTGAIFVKEKLYDSEAKIMEIVWDNAPITAKEISLIAAEKIGWNKNTTYTVIKKLEAKGYIKRDEPSYVCTPAITKTDVQKGETKILIEKLFGGSRKALFSALLEDESISESELEELRRLIEQR